MGYALYGRKGGVPLFAVHGTPGARTMLQPAGEEADRAGVLLIAPDRPGYGLSSPRPGYDLTQWVADVEELLHALKIRRFLLFGVSGGGPFAVALASLMPQRVRALALVGSVGPFLPDIPASWLWRHRLFFRFLPAHPLLMTGLFPLARWSILHLPRLSLKLLISTLSKADRLVLSSGGHGEELLRAFQDGVRYGMQGVRDDLRIFSSPWNLPFERAAMPVCLWHGRDDRMVPAGESHALAKRFSNAVVVEQEGQGHFWIFDHFAQVLQQLQKAA